MPEPKTDQRTELNLLGKVDTEKGESRRNENVQFNLIDNNARKELNSRVGTSATIVQEFLPDRNYFGVEFGGAPAAPLHVTASKGSGMHGTLFETHNNSVFSARTFFQVGDVQPAHQNEYGFGLAAPLWKGGYLSLEGSQQKIRGSVNGNILVPKLNERTPLATDPATRRIVERFLSAYPDIAPNRTDIDPRALNTNAPQSINTDNASGRLDQIFGQRDRFTLRYALTSQQVDAFELLLARPRSRSLPAGSRAECRGALRSIRRSHRAARPQLRASYRSRAKPLPVRCPDAAAPRQPHLESGLGDRASADERPRIEQQSRRAHLQ